MKLKLDENLSPDLKGVLTAAGHDVHTAADEGLLSRPDTEIAAAASVEDRILLTLDLDFSDIRAFPPGTHPGIILFRPAGLGVLEVSRFVEAFVNTTDLNELVGCLAVVEPTRIRVRKPDDEKS